MMIGKALQSGTTLREVLGATAVVSKIVQVRPLKEWEELLGKDLYLKLLGCIALLFESINSRDLEKVFVESQAQSIKENIRSFGLYLWKNYSQNVDRHIDYKELLVKFPMYLSDIDIWNSASIMLYIGAEKMHPDVADFFLTVVFSKAKEIGSCTSETLKNLERTGLEEKSKVFSEFVERISKVNTKNSKNFLITFFKSVKSVCGFSIYKLLFKDISHLYRDNFSFQSILLMNCIILSEYPSTLEEFVKNEPLFLKSIVTLIQHLNHMLKEEDLLDKRLLFKLENTFQLLYLCLSNKAFLEAINTSQVPFREELKRFLETSYSMHLEFPPNIQAKSLICTAVVILEIFPVSSVLTPGVVSSARRHDSIE